MNKTYWINERGHAQGAFWAICACFFSNMCDISVKCLGDSLPSLQITFCGLFLGFLILLPILSFKGRECFAIKDKKLHLYRIIIGFAAISCWIYGARQTSLVSVTAISFVCPLLIFPLAYLFLGEKSDWKRVVLLIIGFIGVIIIAIFEKGEIQKSSPITFFHPGVLYLFISVLLFATSNILNKKMVVSENIHSLLFYFYLGTALISVIPALLVWKAIPHQDITHLLTLGAGGVSVLYCALKAANATELSSTAQYKYIELIISSIAGYVLFGEVIKTSTAIGASLIIISSFLIAFYEISKEKNKHASKIF
jgi:S-adenosylmethionine uptake transporter